MRSGSVASWWVLAVVGAIGAACAPDGVTAPPPAVATSTGAGPATTAPAADPATPTTSSAMAPTTTPTTTSATTSTRPAGSATPTAPTTAPATSPTTATTATTTTTTTTTTTVTTTTAPSPRDDGSIFAVRPASDLPVPALPDGWVSQVIGTSVQGRDITVWERPVPSPTKGILVVGGIHGNEPASPPAVRSFVDADVADDVIVWLLPELNPDGVAAGTRWNANGVDLNRNFPWDWRASDGGPGPLSEPESRAVADFVELMRPGVVVWVHQPYGYVSSVAGTARRYESAWAAGSGLPTRSGVTQHGGGESWTSLDAGLPSMLVEIDGWAATAEVVESQVAGFQALLDELGWSR